MTKQSIDVIEAIEAVKAALEVCRKATPGDWFESGGQIRSLWDHDGRNLYVMRCGDMDDSTKRWVFAARAGYAATLQYLLSDLSRRPPGDTLRPEFGMHHAVAPIVEWCRGRNVEPDRGDEMICQVGEK